MLMDLASAQATWDSGSIADKLWMEVHGVKKGKRHLLNEATPWLGRKVNVGGSTGGGDTKYEAAAAAETKEENPAAQLNYKLCEKNYICRWLVIKWTQRQHVSS
jgi:hypothetical protein